MLADPLTVRALTAGQTLLPVHAAALHLATSSVLLALRFRYGVSWTAAARQRVAAVFRCCPSNVGSAGSSPNHLYVSVSIRMLFRCTHPEFHLVQSCLCVLALMRYYGFTHMTLVLHTSGRFKWAVSSLRVSLAHRHRLRRCARGVFVYQ